MSLLADFFQRTMQHLAPETEATRLRARVGIAQAAGTAPWRMPTPPRHMRKGEDGQRKPGAYGKHLRRHFDSKLRPVRPFSAKGRA